MRELIKGVTVVESGGSKSKVLQLARAMPIVMGVLEEASSRHDLFEDPRKRPLVKGIAIVAPHVALWHGRRVARASKNGLYAAFDESPATSEHLALATCARRIPIALGCAAMRNQFLKTGLADYVSAEAGGSKKLTIDMMTNNAGARAMLLAQVTADEYETGNGVATAMVTKFRTVSYARVQAAVAASMTGLLVLEEPPKRACTSAGTRPALRRPRRRRSPHRRPRRRLQSRH